MTPTQELRELAPGQLVRAKNKDVREWLLEIGSLTRTWMYNGKMYVVRWKGIGLGLTEVWLEPKHRAKEQGDG